MPSVCCYFQVHQPFRIRRFSYFDSSKEFDYFDDQANGQILRKVAQKCYLPTNELMLRMIEEHEGRFRIAYSISGVAMDQFAKYSPETLESFRKLAETGCVEFLGETYYHSLASIYSPAEFERQVRLHAQLMQRHFGMTPTVFRNTELIYDDTIGRAVSRMGYRGIIAEGADDILDWRSPNYVYRVAGGDASLLLKNYRLSDDVAFRFSNREWSHYPLTADTFARWIHGVSGAGEVVNLFMDYETFGEHQWESTGIFEFMKHFPKELFRHADWGFQTPSEVVDQYDPVAELPFHRTTSWADIERDLTAWRGNSMQTKALATVYGLAEIVDRIDDPVVHNVWRRLQTSDHFYYMCTKWFADGDVHAYFSPFETPYDAFLNYENILKDFSSHLGTSKPTEYFELPAPSVHTKRALTSAA